MTQTKKGAKATALAPRQESALSPKRVATLAADAIGKIAKLLSADLAPPQLSEVVDELRQLDTLIESLTHNARERLKAIVLREGKVVSETGSKVLDVDGWRIEARAMNSDCYEDARVEVLLRNKGIDPNRGMDATVKWKTNPYKLTTCGLTEEELRLCKKEKMFILQKPRRHDDKDES